MVDFPAPDRPVNHSTAGRCLFCGAGGLVDLDRLPVHVVRAAQREVQQPGTDGVVGDAIDEDEAAHVAVFGVGVERDGPVEAEVATPISFNSSVFAAACSSVLTFTLYFGCARVAPTVRVPSLSRYGRPASIGSSFIQTMWASNWSATPGGASGRSRARRRG